ncbi:MAG: malate:quinone oxidoreductase, partial [Puniceicoccales bacterium]
AVGKNNMDLTRYLINQVRQGPEERLEALREFFPEAKGEDWTLRTAGQRVQIIKQDEKGRGVLEFGTEIVAAADGSLAALLGASPGASTAVSTMIEVLERCFPDRFEEWRPKLEEMVPSYGKDIGSNPAAFLKLRERSSELLQLNKSAQAVA